jgi:ribosomal protein S27AE
MTDQDDVKQLGGRCPTCGGSAIIYTHPELPYKGHIYCNEDGCGWIHRDRMVEKYITEKP